MQSRSAYVTQRRLKMKKATAAFALSGALLFGLRLATGLTVDKGKPVYDYMQ